MNIKFTLLKDGGSKKMNLLKFEIVCELFLNKYSHFQYGSGFLPETVKNLLHCAPNSWVLVTFREMTRWVWCRK